MIITYNASEIEGLFNVAQKNYEKLVKEVQTHNSSIEEEQKKILKELEKVVSDYKDCYSPFQRNLPSSFFENPKVIEASKNWKYYIIENWRGTGGQIIAKWKTLPSVRRIWKGISLFGVETVSLTVEEYHDLMYWVNYEE